MTLFVTQSTGGSIQPGSVWSAELSLQPKPTFTGVGRINPASKLSEKSEQDPMTPCVVSGKKEEKFSSRPYQLEMLDESLKRNVILTVCHTFFHLPVTGQANMPMPDGYRQWKDPCVSVSNLRTLLR